MDNPYLMVISYISSIRTKLSYSIPYISHITRSPANEMSAGLLLFLQFRYYIVELGCEMQVFNVS